MCPSAMKCVPKTNCDLKGVMTDTAQNYSPEVEALRVPLIPCVNREAGNSVDVCCRDPNYKDPWPGGMMMMMGAGGAGAKAGGAQVQGRPQRQGQKKTQGKKKRPSNTKKQGPAKKKGHSSSGLGACSSNADCPAGTPVCSEYVCKVQSTDMFILIPHRRLQGESLRKTLFSGMATASVLSTSPVALSAGR